jgi:hypothetical protein
MTKSIPSVPVGHIPITPENKCSFCKGSTCCTYLTHPIDTPRSMKDFDLLLWQVSHANTQVYEDEDGWFLLVNNHCLHLEPGGRCGIYADRPQVCRDHGNDECEFDGSCSADDFERFFPDYASLLKYCRERFKHWERRLQATPENRKNKPKTPTRR